jgi:hypothetical protein
MDTNGDDDNVGLCGTGDKMDKGGGTVRGDMGDKVELVAAEVFACGDNAVNAVGVNGCWSQ